MEITKHGLIVGFHTLTFTIQAPPDYVRYVAAGLVAPGHEDTAAWLPIGHGGRGYREIHLGPLGVKVYTLPVDGSDRCTLEIPGSAVDTISAEHLHDFATSLEQAGVRWWASRGDIYADHCPFTPKDLLGAFQRGDIRSVVKTTNARSWGWHQNGEGSTFTLGSRSSERYLRVYDARGYTRTELEFKGERARLVLREVLLSPPGEWAVRFLAHLRQFVDFVDASADTNISRAPLLAWWRAFVGGVEKAALHIAKPLPTLARVASWLRRQVAASVAMMEKADPYAFGDFLVNLLQTGREKLGPRHKLILAMNVPTATIAST
ncbi:replication initiation factor domain-containing protein [Meiothermus sp.]|uniref:replication initiation factor domain-containing protein n=1 Tax=Meiothermus sp. TaxID=1955249 RepID=UPI00262C080C|nr:replication initiation factor domain-containing protein [Meiothermus sp.]